MHGSGAGVIGYLFCSMNSAHRPVCIKLIWMSSFDETDSQSHPFQFRNTFSPFRMFSQCFFSTAASSPSPIGVVIVVVIVVVSSTIYNRDWSHSLAPFDVFDAVHKVMFVENILNNRRVPCRLSEIKNVSPFLFSFYAHWNNRLNRVGWIHCVSVLVLTLLPLFHTDRVCIMLGGIIRANSDVC